MKYSLAKPIIGKEEKKAVLSVLDSGYLALGPKIIEFEKEFAKKLGVKYACAISSGTAGLHLALIAAGLRTGDEVITSSFSFIASANAILYLGAKPVFVDIDPVSYNIDPKKIEQKITSKTKAILVVHILGQAADMGPILKIAKKYNLKIVEDACESILATYKNKKVGTFGEAGVFAFYPNKQMTTGEGGMIITNKRSVYELVKSLSNQGRSANMQWLDHKYLGYNYRMDEMSAALGLIQLKKLDFFIKKRRQIVAWYEEYLKGYEKYLLAPETVAENFHTWFVYVIKLKNAAIRNKVMEGLLKAGIGTKPYLPAIHLFSFYKKMGFKKGDLPVCEKISSSTLALPFYIGLTENDIKKICKVLTTIIKKHV
jgi:perosamine synthetase